MRQIYSGSVDGGVECGASVVKPPVSDCWPLYRRHCGVQAGKARQLFRVEGLAAAAEGEEPRPFGPVLLECAEVVGCV